MQAGRLRVIYSKYKTKINNIVQIPCICYSGRCGFLTVIYALTISTVWKKGEKYGRH